MVHPAYALLVFTVVAAAVVLLFWPRRGVGARWRRLRRLDERVRLEDALKHVYMCERRGQACTLESLAGRLEISVDAAATLLSRLTHLELVRPDRDAPELTEQGRASALQVVRTHRLWERYLADRTGIPAGEWHDEAERMEHTLSAAEVDALESRLGHPRFDPHGDPIPTAGGEIPPVRGTALLNAGSGATVEVLHLEDEPRAIYDRLVSFGMGPGIRLDVLERSERGMRVQGDGRAWTLDPVEARNVTVRLLPSGERARESALTLADLVPGESARVLALSPACQGTQRRRLLDLGVVRETEITAEMSSASGDPMAYRIRGALIALRREQAAWVLVEPVGAGAAEVA